MYIALPFGGGDQGDDPPSLSSKLLLEVHFTFGMYPDLLPMVFITMSRKWNKDAECSGDGGDVGPRTEYRCGGRIHLNLV